MHKRSAIINRPAMRGFTLIEAAISILILGLLLVPLFLLYNTYMAGERERVTYQNIQRVADALENYRNQFGFYPCPAPLEDPLNTTEAQSRYGQQVCASIVFGLPCQNGVCTRPPIEARATQLAASGLTPAEASVMVGAVPFRDLQLLATEALDGYNNRIVYAVSRHKTTELLYTAVSDGGSIQILNATSSTSGIASGGGPPPASVDMTDPPGAAVYVLISHGQNARGAFTMNGTLASPCTGPSADENKNCQVTSTEPASYVARPLSRAEGANFFDDFVLYFRRNELQEKWARQDQANQALDWNNISTSNPANLALGLAAPLDGVNMHINNRAPGQRALDIRGPGGANGRLISDRICVLGEDEADPLGTRKCLKWQALHPQFGGGYSCPAGQYLAGISNGAPVCVHILEYRCPASAPVLAGINANGTLRCSEMIDLSGSCPEISGYHCGLPFNLPGQGSSYWGQLITINHSDGNDCLKRTWQCSKSNSVWTMINETGQCNFFQPPPPPQDVDFQCPDGTLGTKTVQQQCDGSLLTLSEDVMPCGTVSCPSGGTSKLLLPCPPPLVGSGILKKVTWMLGFEESGNACLYSVNEELYNDCSCGSTGYPQTVTQSCPGGGSITITKTLDDNCNVVETPNGTCSCDKDPVQTTQVKQTCVEGGVENICMVQTVTKVQTLDSATCTYGPAEDVLPLPACVPKAFKWVPYKPSNFGQSDNPSIPVLGSSCSCDDHQAHSGPPKQPNICRQNTNLFECWCQ